MDKCLMLFGGLKKKHDDDFQQEHGEDSIIEQPIWKAQVQKSQRMHTSIVCYILCPLILSIIFTTGLSITVFTVLSPYWSHQGGQLLIQDQISILISLSVVMGNSMTDIMQKYSNTRSQIHVYYWRNVQMQNYDKNIYFRSQKIFDHNAINLNRLVNELSLRNSLLYYNQSTNESTYYVVWGIVDQQGILNSKITNTSQLTKQQNQDLLLYGSTLPLLQVFYANNQNQQNHVFFHSVSGMFVYYPLRITANYSQTPIQQMQNDYMNDHSSVHKSILVNLQEGQIDICDAIISLDQIFQGVICQGMQISILQTTFTYFGSQLNESIDTFTIMANNELSTISNSMNNLSSIDSQGLRTYHFPDFLQTLFPTGSNIVERDYFLNQFGPVLNKNSSLILYQSSYVQNQQTLQAVVRGIYTNEIGIIDQYQGIDTQQATLMIQFVDDHFTGEFSQLAGGIQYDTFVRIMVSSIPIGVVMCLLAWLIAFKIIRGISIPLLDLHQKLVLLTDDTLSIQVYSNFKQSSLDVNQLYEAFHRLITVLNFANPKYFEGNEADLLIKYSEGLVLFECIECARGVGLNLNNIANIHRSNKRYQEAIDYYKDSIFLCEEDLLQLTGSQTMEMMYPVLRKNKYKLSTITKTNIVDRQNSVRFQKIVPEIIGHQRRKSLSSRGAAPAIFISNQKEIEENKSILEELHSNRNFSLSTTLMEFAKVSGMMEKDQLYKETIDRLQFTIFLDEQNKRNMLHRQIISRTLLCECYLEIEDIDGALQQIEMAEELLDEYEQIDEAIVSLTTLNINPGILRQKTLLQKGALCLRLHNSHKAAKYFTECLKTSKVYDPEIRLSCLQYLHDIMKEYKLLDKVEAQNIPKILQQSQKKKNKDIVFVVDFSESMQNQKKDFAIGGVLKIFDQYMQNQDRIAFMRFNQSLNVVFELTQRDDNPKFLRNAIENSLKQIAKGESALLQAIIYGQQLFKKTIEKDHSKWIVVITDGDDNLSKMSYRKMERLLSSHADISLIIIGIALPIECMEELNGLCRMTKQGLFIQSIESEDLDIAFQALTNLINTNFDINQNVELLTH